MLWAFKDGGSAQRLAPCFRRGGACVKRSDCKNIHEKSRGGKTANKFGFEAERADSLLCYKNACLQFAGLFTPDELLLQEGCFDSGLGKDTPYTRALNP